MTQARPALRVKLIVGLIARDPEWFDLAAAPLADRFGAIDLRSDVIPFDLTHYYDDVMGTGLHRQFLAFESLVDPTVLPDAKLFANALELELAATIEADVPRPLNIDPGYITEAKLVLASAKNFTHRVCLRDGIYAEVTLHYRDDAWRPWPWTFPDYRTAAYHEFFQRVRNRLREQLKAD